MLMSALLTATAGFATLSAEEPTAKAGEKAESGLSRLPRDNLLLYHDSNGKPAAVKSVDDWAKRRTEVVRGMEAIMGRLPGEEKRCPLDMKIEEEFDGGTFVRRLITYAAEPGGRVPAYLLIPKDLLAGTRKAPAVLCLHGTNDVIGPGSVVGLGTLANRDYALELAQRGYVTLAPNYPLLAKYRPDLNKLGWQSCTLKAIWDNMRGIDLLASLPYVDASRGFGAIGHSLGGHNSVYTAVFDDRLTAIVSSCGLDSFLDYFGGDPNRWGAGKGWCQKYYMPALADYKDRLADIPFDFQEMVGALAPRHVLIVAPTKDSNFRADSVDRIAAAARPIFKLYGAEDGLRIEHPKCGHDFPPEMREAAYKLFDAVLAGKLDQYFQPPPEQANDFGSFRSPLKFYDGRAVQTADDWPARRREILDRWHAIMGQWPPLLKDPKIEYLQEQRRDNFTQRHVRIQIAPDRSTDDCYLLKPDGDGPFPAVVVVYYESLTGIGLGKSPLRDFASQLARRGFVTLSLGSDPSTFYPSENDAQLQPLSLHAYMAANCWQALANLPFVDARRIGIVGHSYGGKWAMFASCLFDKFACAAWSDGGIVFDESRAGINYWEPWYLGHEPGKPPRPKGIPDSEKPRTGAYKALVEQGLDLHELHALMAPRPFLVSGGAEDTPRRWPALNHTIAVNKLLGFSGRVAMTNRQGHSPTLESNEQVYRFFEHFLNAAPASP